MKRITVRFNDVEEAELNLLKTTFHVDDDSKAVKLAIEWVNSYLKNVTKTFFPQTYDVILQKKSKIHSTDRKVY